MTLPKHRPSPIQVKGARPLVTRALGDYSAGPGERTVMLAIALDIYASTAQRGEGTLTNYRDFAHAAGLDEAYTLTIINKLRFDGLLRATDIPTAPRGRMLRPTLGAEIHDAPIIVDGERQQVERVCDLPTTWAKNLSRLVLFIYACLNNDGAGALSRATLSELTSGRAKHGRQRHDASPKLRDALKRFDRWQHNGLPPLLPITEPGIGRRPSHRQLVLPPACHDDARPTENPNAETWAEDLLIYCAQRLRRDYPSAVAQVWPDLVISGAAAGCDDDAEPVPEHPAMPHGFEGRRSPPMPKPDQLSLLCAKALPRSRQALRGAAAMSARAAADHSDEPSPPLALARVLEICKALALDLLPLELLALARTIDASNLAAAWRFYAERITSAPGVPNARAHGELVLTLAAEYRQCEGTPEPSEGTPEPSEGTPEPSEEPPGARRAS